MKKRHAQQLMRPTPRPTDTLFGPVAEREQFQYRQALARASAESELRALHRRFEAIHDAWRRTVGLPALHRV